MSDHHHRLSRRPWARIRLAVLARDDWKCRCCGAWGAEVDHVIPLDRGGAVYDMANLQTLCTADHIRKTAEENRPEPSADRRKWIEYIAGMARAD